MEKKMRKTDRSFAAIGGQRNRKARIEQLFTNASGTEDVSRREENVKYFKLGGNRHQAVVYAEPVHFRDPITGKWEDIDNTLEEAVTAHGRRVLRNRAGNMHVEFPCRADGGNMVSISENGATFSWSFEKETKDVEAQVLSGVQMRQAHLIKRAQKLPKYVGRTVESLQAADLSADAEIETEQERRGEIAKLSAENTYNQILPGVSVRYTISGSKVKEDIIVDNEDALSNVAIRLPDDFIYEVSDGSKLIVKDKVSGKRLFSMDTPIVFDAQDKSIEGGIVLTPCEGYTRMEYNIDEEYLKDAVFPITIDPVVKADTHSATIYYADLCENGTVTRNEFLRVGVASDNNQYVSLLKFDMLPALSASDTIVSAQLQMRQHTSYASRRIGVYELLADYGQFEDVSWGAGFDPYSATYVNQVAEECIVGGGYANYAMLFDLTNLYNKWCRNRTGMSGNANNENRGIVFRSPANMTGDNFSKMYSSNKAGDYYKPVIYVNYVSHAGVEGWWQYEQMSAGRAGTVYTDLFNGNMVLEHSDTVMTGNRNPVSVSHYYNSCLSAENNFHCGNGWKTNMHQTIRTEVINDVKYFVWLDGDGTEHFFLDTDNGTLKYYDSEGMGLVLSYEYISNPFTMGTASEYRKFTLTDKSDNKMIFYAPALFGSEAENYEKQIGKLYQIKDAQGNTVSFEYIGNSNAQEPLDRIKRITDPAGRETVFNYDNEGVAYNDSLLTSIQIPDVGQGSHRTIWFFYDNNDNLESIQYSELLPSGINPGNTGNKHTIFEYEANSRMLKTARNYDGIGVHVEYEELSNYYVTGTDTHMNNQVRRVSEMEVNYKNPTNVNAATVSGVKQSFVYKNMWTEVTAWKNDANSDENKTLYYQFNDSGNVVCVRDELGFAQFTAYESGIENKPSASSSLRKPVINLLLNPDFSANWVGTESANLEDRCLNAPAVKLTSAASPYQEITLDAGKEYVFSAYVKADTNASASLKMKLKSNDAVVASSEAVTAAMLHTTNNEMPADGWERISVVLDCSSNTSAVTYKAALCMEGTGTAWFACPQIEEGHLVSPVNFVTNGDFRYTETVTVENGLAPQCLAKGWDQLENTIKNGNTGVQTRTYPAPNQVAEEKNTFMPSTLTGSYIQVEGVPNQQEVGFVQEFNLKGNEGDVYVIGGWADSESIPNATTVERAFGISMQLKKANGTWADAVLFPFNGERVGWQFGSWAVVADQNYEAIRMRLLYNQNCGLAKFSNVFLHREQFGTSYAYDEDENVASTGNLAGQKSDIKYDNADNVISYIQPGRDTSDTNNRYVFYYGDSTTAQEKHLIRHSYTPQKVTDIFTHDTYGNPTSNYRVDYSERNKQPSTLTKEHISSDTVYTSDGNYVKESYDARNNKVSKEVNLNTGLVTSVTDPANQRVDYTYDKAKRVTEVKAEVGGNVYKNQYTYENDRIKTVTHNTSASAADDVKYTFNYDALGRKTSVLVGTDVLSENVYASDRSGLLTSVKYGPNGNCGKVSYAYDGFDRMTGVKFDTEIDPRFVYNYGKNGRVAEVIEKENVNGTMVKRRATHTEFDLADRPCRVETRDAQDSLLYRTQLYYDKCNNLSTFAEKVKTGTTAYENHTTAYTYDADNRITELAYDSTDANPRKIAYVFDELGRVDKRTATVGTNSIETTYSYVTRTDNVLKSSPLVASITQPGMNFSYEYDNRGNIISETRNTVETTYAYDALGQLIRVNDPNDTTAGASGTTWVYEYDLGGNILKKSYYAYTTAVTPSGTPVEYVYNYDSSWKDKLMSVQKKVNGVVVSGETKTFAYNDIGNPTTYDGWTCEWEGGRQLKKMVKGSTIIEFKYNHNGLRTHKSVTENGVTTTTEYTLHGKLITHLTKRVVNSQNVETDREELHFFYDSQSKPAFVEYGGAMYRYVHNLQGDIVAIVDTAGNAVVEYKYDAWGKPIGVLTEDGVGAINPFRYRGYVWDKVTDLYYLNSRYYSAHFKRFISSDVFVNSGILGINTYVYCLNNPIVRGDMLGYDSYYVVMNIYERADWNYNRGHYDLSIISKEDSSTGWTFSYGPIKPENGEIDMTKAYDARFDAYAAPSREKTPVARVVLFEDLSSEEYLSFKEWFNSEFESFDEPKIVAGIKRYRYKVTSGEYSKYDTENAKYCGSGLAYLVSKLYPSITNIPLSQAMMKLNSTAWEVDQSTIDYFTTRFIKYE